MPDWTGVITIEGEATGDGRLIELGALQWDAGPWPVIWDREDGDHTGAVVGAMTRIWRDGGLVRGEGDWSDSMDDATRTAVIRVRELQDEGAVGVSVGLDSETVQIRIRDDAELLLASVVGDIGLAVAEADRPWSAAAARNRVFELFTTDGVVDTRSVARAFLWRTPDADPSLRSSYSLGYADVEDGELVVVPRAVPPLASGIDRLNASDSDKDRMRMRVCGLHDRVSEFVEDFAECPFSDNMETIVEASYDDILRVVTSARIRHLAIVDTPAFADARIGAPVLAAIGRATDEDFTDPAFGRDGHSDPRLSRQDPERPGEGVTWGAPLTVLEDGRVFGHACLWGRCHAGFRDRCVIPPRNGDYSRFLHGEAAPGVRTGPLTVGTTHAAIRASATEAMDHYSHTGRAVADVTVGEDSLGLWVAGRLRPGASTSDIAALRGSSLSGDWRPVNGRYRLCGLLAVNQPGYLVQRASENGAVITAGPCSCDDLEAEEIEGVLLSTESDDLLAPVVAALADRVSALEELVALVTAPITDT
jgi:hypothetical protein